MSFDKTEKTILLWTGGLIVVICVVALIGSSTSSPASQTSSAPIHYSTASDLPVKPDNSARDAYARELESHLLSRGLDATVRAIGKNHDTLRISWAAMSRPVVYNMMNGDGMRQQVPELGFKKVILTDDGSFSGGGAETWAYRWDGSSWKR